MPRPRACRQAALLLEQVEAQKRVVGLIGDGRGGRINVALTRRMPRSVLAGSVFLQLGFQLFRARQTPA
jgi:hypothetical protein